MESLSKVRSTTSTALITVKPARHQPKDRHLRWAFPIALLIVIATAAHWSCMRNHGFLAIGLACAMIVCIVGIMLEKKLAQKYGLNEPDMPDLPTNFPPPNPEDIRCVFVATKDHFILSPAREFALENIRSVVLTCKKIPAGIKYQITAMDLKMSFIQLEPERKDLFGRKYHEALCRDIYRGAIQTVTLALTHSDGSVMTLNDLEVTKSA